YFDGMELSAQQLSDIEELEVQFDEAIDNILPLSPEAEEQIFTLEDAFDTEVETLFSAQQQGQLEQIDQWADEQVFAVAPELFDEDDIDESSEEIELTSQQETALDEIEEEYEKRVEAILTAEQSTKIEVLEEQLEEDIDAILPEPNEAQIVSLEAAESDLKASVMQLLSAEQQQQLESNLACYEDE
ncbi:MAG: hypothetical protein AAFQ57_16220, partial [Cyanobacteria bacterium J06626_14]